jgi:hypothetical protein
MRQNHSVQHQKGDCQLTDLWLRGAECSYACESQKYSKNSRSSRARFFPSSILLLILLLFPLENTSAKAGHIYISPQTSGVACAELGLLASYLLLFQWRASPYHTHSHVCGNSHRFEFRHPERRCHCGAGGICGDHVNVRHRNADGDRCVWGQYTWVFPTANTMPLRARPRKWLTCEPGLRVKVIIAVRQRGYSNGSDNSHNFATRLVHHPALGSFYYRLLLLLW